MWACGSSTRSTRIIRGVGASMRSSGGTRIRAGAFRAGARRRVVIVVRTPLRYLGPSFGEGLSGDPKRVIASRFDEEIIGGEGTMTFDPMEPFASSELLAVVMEGLDRFEFKLYGRIPRRLHRGEPTKYEFDLNLGVIHFTEQDFRELSRFFDEINRKWGTEMTFCLYPSKECNREMILNIRGSPMAPSEID